MTAHADLAEREEATAYLISPVQRAVRLLQFVAEGGSTSNLSEAARQVGINRATLARLLDTLEYERVLERGAGGGDYRLGSRFLGLAASALSSQDLLQLARPVLAGLAAGLGLSAYLTVLSGGEVLYLLREVPDVPLVSNVRLGSRVAAHLTAPGRIMVAYHSLSARRRLLGPEPLAQATPQTPSTYAALDILLDADRERGCAWSFAAYEAGINSCAAPVIDAAGRATTAISLAGPAAAFEPAATRLPTIEAKVRAAATTLSQLIGGGGRSAHSRE